MRIMRERLPGGWCAHQMLKGAKSAPKGVWETVKTEIDTSFSYQGDKNRAAAVTMQASTVNFSTAC